MDDNSIQRIKSANDIKASKALELERHEDMRVAFISVQETILKSFTSLVNYLDGKVTKTVIVNQLREIGTPDALKVIPSIESLHETLKTHKNTDLTELTKLMTEMLAEAKMIPKDHMKMPEMKMMDYSAQLKELGKAVKAVETVIKAQKLVVEAPVVNVDAPVVNVDAPDLKPLQGGLKDVVSAIKKIIIPEYKTDNKAVEALIKKSNELLKKLLEKPVSSGGGGSGRVSPYSDSNGMPSFVTLVNGKIPVDVDMATEGIATEATLAKLQPTVNTPTVYNITLTNANTEYSQALPANTREFRFIARTLVNVRYAWVTGKVATPTAPYLTLPAGMEYASDNDNLPNQTLYLASATAGTVIEVETWTIS